MKSKRRHELQTNDLADRLGHFIERVRPYTTVILLVAVGIAVILSAGYYLASSKSKKQGLAWRYFMAAGTDPQRDVSDQLAEVADDFDGTAAGLWASQTAGDLELSRGVRMLFTDRASADTSLTQARTFFQEVIEHPDVKNFPMLSRRARLGLAQTQEALGELEKAKEQYQLVVKEAEQDAIGTVAKDRLKKLERPESDNFYAWFSQQKPVPPAATGGGSSSPLGDLLDSPGAGFGGLGDSPGSFMSNTLGSSTDDAPAEGASPDAGKSEDDATQPPTEDSTSPPAKPDDQPPGDAQPEKSGDPASDPGKS